MPTAAQPPGRRLRRGTVIALVTALAPVAAAAQQSATDSKIDAIERQIQQLQGELKHLKHDLVQTKQQLQQSHRETARARAQAQQATQAAEEARRQAESAAVSEAQAKAAAAHVAAAPPPAAPGPKVVQTKGNRFGLESADGANSIFLTGRLHYDMGVYPDYTPGSKYASVQNLDSGVNARRARIGVVGKFAQDWAYGLILDFGGSSDGQQQSYIQTALITYNGLNHGPNPLAFDVGYQDSYFTLDEAISSNDIMFVERPAIVNVVSNVFAGDFRSQAGVRSGTPDYFWAIYGTGPNSGANHTTGEQFGAYGRATYQFWRGPEHSLHLGVDAGGLIKPPTVSGVNTITLSERPEDRIDPVQILSTGSLGTVTNPVNNAAAYGVEAALDWRNFYLQGEYYTVMVNRAGLPNNWFGGGYIEGSWAITGEHRDYNPDAGAYKSIVPFEPFSPWSGQHGWGAWELAARFSTVGLNDNFVSGSPPGNSNAVGGGRQTVYQFGINWYPNRNIRFMLDYLHGFIHKGFSTMADSGVAGTPLGAEVGGSFDALVLRSQFAF